MSKTTIAIQKIKDDLDSISGLDGQTADWIKLLEEYIHANVSYYLLEENSMSVQPLGIIKRIDDFGRIAIPKEIRRKANIYENDPVEVFSLNDGIYLRKLSEKDELGNTINKILDIIMEEYSNIPKKIKEKTSELLEELKKFDNQEKDI